MESQFIKPFSLDHWIFIFLMVGVVILFIKNRHTLKKHERTFSLVILGICILQQILLYSYLIISMGLDWGEILPLHISRVTTILCIIYLITKNRNVFFTLSYFGVFAWLAFLYPSRIDPITHPLGVSFFINHVITLLMPYFAMSVHHKRIRPGDKIKAFRFFLLYLSVAIVANIVFDGNYFYLKYHPIFPTLSNLIYIPLAILVTLVLFSLIERWFYWIQEKI